MMRTSLHGVIEAADRPGPAVAPVWTTHRHKPGPEPTRLVYILGAGHSGSTLLAMLFGAHPEICTIGEVKAPAVHDVGYKCSCGQRIDECEFWQAMVDLVAQGGATLDLPGGTTDFRRARSPYVRRLLRPLHRGPILEWVREAALSISPTWKPHLQRFDVLSAAVARAACELTGTHVFVDSSKTGIQLKYLLRNPALDVKVIRLVRDGRGVSNSYRKSDGLSFADAAFLWRRSNEEAAAIVEQLAVDRWFDLRYEALCSNLTATMGELVQFAGVKAGPVRFDIERRQHVLGNNKMRLNPAQIRLDEKWRKALSAEDIRTFDRVAGALNRELGYAP